MLMELDRAEEEAAATLGAGRLDDLPSRHSAGLVAVDPDWLGAVVAPGAGRVWQRGDGGRQSAAGRQDGPALHLRRDRERQPPRGDGRLGGPAGRLVADPDRLECGFSGDGGRTMATDRLEADRARPAGRDWRPTAWPIGRWLLIAAVLGWFGLLVLVPSLALRAAGPSRRARDFFEMLATPEVMPGVRADAGDHRDGDGGQHGLRHGIGAGAGPASVLGAGPAGRDRRSAVRRLAGRGRADAGGALRARGMAGSRARVRRDSRWSTPCPG